MKNLFTTKNRKLEQFLYVHDIHFLTWSKDIDSMTEWLYEPTNELYRVVNEWRDIQQRKKYKTAGGHLQ